MPRFVSTPGGRLLAAMNKIPIEAVPLSVHRFVIPLKWNQDCLWTLRIPVTPMRTTDLEWQLDLPAWSHQGVPFRVTPNEVAADPNAYPEQYQRALDAACVVLSSSPSGSVGGRSSMDSIACSKPG